MPTGAVLISVLYRRAGTTTWQISDQLTAGGGFTRIDELTAGHTYEFATPSQCAPAEKRARTTIVIVTPVGS